MTIIRHRKPGGGGSEPGGLEQRLAALEAAEAARGVLARYAEAVDHQDVGGVAALLADDVTLAVGDLVIEGRSGVVEFFKNAFVDDPARKSHFITNVETRWLGGGLVDVDAYFFWTAGETKRSVIGWGTYSDQVRVASGSALLTRVEIDIRHVGDLNEGWTVG